MSYWNKIKDKIKGDVVKVNNFFDKLAVEADDRREKRIVKDTQKLNRLIREEESLGIKKQILDKKKTINNIKKETNPLNGLFDSFDTNKTNDNKTNNDKPKGFIIGGDYKIGLYDEGDTNANRKF